MVRALGVPARGGRMWRLAAATALLLALFIGALGSPGRVAAAGVVVYDQPASPIGSRAGATPPFTWADDFVVPAGGWTFNEVGIVGDTADPLATAFTVAIYRNDAQANLPGALVASYPGLSDPAPTNPSGSQRLYSLALPDPLALPQGTYWVAAQGNNEFMWDLAATPAGLPGAGRFADGPWVSIGYYDFAFRLVLAERATAVGAVAGAATYAGTAALTATVTRQSDGQPVPVGGVVEFTLNGQPAGTGTTDANGVATASAPLSAGIGAGGYPGAVGASYAGAPGYAPSAGTGALTVAKATQTIAFPQPPDAHYGDAPFTVSATATSGLPVTFAAGPASVCTASGLNGATITLVGPGACTIVASQAGNANYQPAPDVAHSVGVAPCDGKFTDVAAGDPACTAVAALVNRGVIAGYATTPPRFGPDDKVQRAQVAAFLVRALGWQNRPQGPRTFSDFDGLVPDLRTASLIVANACTGQGRCVASGFGDGTFGPTKMVTKAEVIAFIARAFGLDAKYAWADQPNGPQPYNGVPAVHETAIRTYTYYAGTIPDAPTSADGWNAPASRAWVARVLYQALQTKP